MKSTEKNLIVAARLSASIVFLSLSSQFQLSPAEKVGLDAAVISEANFKRNLSLVSGVIMLGWATATLFEPNQCGCHHERDN